MSCAFSSLPTPLRVAAHVVGGIVVVAVFAGVFGWVVMWSWNILLPPLFSLPALSFPQAFALLLLGRVLTGRFSHGHHRWGHHCRWSRRGRLSPDEVHGDLFAEWWDVEGEASFRYFLRQRKDGNKAE